MKQIAILREAFTAKQTIGRLFVNGNFVCYTIEGQCRPDGVQVGDAPVCIPEGTYRASVGYSTVESRKRGERVHLAKVENVPGFTLIRIFGGEPDDGLANSIRVGDLLTSAGKDLLGFKVPAEDRIINALGKDSSEEHLISISNCRDGRTLISLNERDTASGYRILSEIGTLKMPKKN